MKQIPFIILLLFFMPISSIFTHSLQAQTVTFSFPALPNGKVKVYYFQGAKLDSLAAQLNMQGEGSIRFPEGFQGFVQTVVNRASLVEFIAGEDNLFIESKEAIPNYANINYTNSPENHLFFSIMERKKRNEEQKAWLEAGMELYKQEKKLRKNLYRRVIQNKKEKAAIEKEIVSSPLYAARFIEINDFADKLFYAESLQDTARIRYVKEYLLSRMDWKTLYTAGQSWTMVHNYTISMFNKENPNRPLEETQQLYAEFVSPLLLKVEGDIRQAMILSILSECETFEWEIAKGSIMDYATVNNIAIDWTDAQLTRFVKSNKVKAGTKAPSGRGDFSPRKAILMFYDPTCDNCDKEIANLELYREVAQEQGYQVFLLSSEDHETLFHEYGVLATPTIFVINEEGIIQGRYAHIVDAIIKVGSKE